MHYVANYRDIEDNPQFINSCSSFTFFDPGEERQSLTDLVKYAFDQTGRARPRFRTELGKKIRKGRMHYVCNSVNPGYAPESWVTSWRDYDWFLAWQTPHPLELPTRHYHCQNRIRKYHRTQTVKALWRMDQFRNGTVSYTQDPSAEWKPYGDPTPTGTPGWEGAVYGWLPSEHYDESLVMEWENNPPPPVSFWSAAALNIITETITRYGNTTEKTWSSVLWGRAWLGIGGKGLHQDFQAQGFELLPYVDYSFDSREAVDDRIQGVIDTVRKLLDNDAKEVYYQFKPTVEHNRLELINKIAHYEFPDWFVDSNSKWLPHAERMRQNVYKAQQKAQALLDDYPNITW